MWSPNSEKSYRLRQSYMTWNSEKLKNSTWRFLGWASSHSAKIRIWQVRQWASPLISVSIASLFVGLVLAMTTSPPAWKFIGIKPLLGKLHRSENHEWSAKLEVLHLFRWFTHTHTQQNKTTGVWAFWCEHFHISLWFLTKCLKHCQTIWNLNVERWRPSETKLKIAIH